VELPGMHRLRHVDSVQFEFGKGGAIVYDAAV
jgi:hypothetical protein